MPVALHDETPTMLEDLPPYLRSDPAVQTTTDVIVRELERLSGVVNQILKGIIPSTADDTYGFLTMWERLLGLPEAPQGISEEDRRNKVLTSIQMRNSGSGADWIALITQGLGTADWSHQEGTAYDLTITVPQPSGNFNIGVVEQMLKKFTPAHLGWSLQYGDGFIIGSGITDDTSQIGIDEL